MSLDTKNGKIESKMKHNTAQKPRNKNNTKTKAKNNFKNKTQEKKSTSHSHALGLSGLLNCCSMKAFSPISATMASAFATAPPMPLVAGVRTSLAPKA